MAIITLVVLIVIFRKRKKELLLSLLSVTFTMGVLEVGVRMVSPQIMEHDKLFEYDTELGWTFIPNKKGNILYPGEAHHYIQINSEGFRDNERVKKKKKILVLGDSFVSNIAVKDDEVFTEVMEAQLPQVDVLNFGVNGYGQVQEYLQLKKWLDKIKPDLIVLMVYLRNDFTDNVGENWLYPRPSAIWDEDKGEIRFEPVPDFDPSIYSQDSFWRIYRKLHLYYWVRRKLGVLFQKWNTKKVASAYTPPEEYLCKVSIDENTRLMYKTMEKLLDKISTYSREKNTPIMLAIAPSIVQAEDQLWKDFSSTSGRRTKDFNRTLPNDSLKIYAQKLKIKTIDLLPVLREEYGLGNRLYNPMEQHWNKQGNELVANELLDYISKNKLLK